MWDEIYQTRKTEFDHSSKHLEESWKCDGQPSILDEVRGGNVVKHCLECLIYLLNRNLNQGKIGQIKS